MPLVKIYTKGTGGGGGGNAVVVLGTGAISSERCGANNAALACATTVLGQCNQAKNAFASVTGGFKNTAGALYNGIVNGTLNSTNGYFGFIGTGKQNVTCNGTYSAIVNGKGNISNGSHGAIINGCLNQTIASSSDGFIGNGYYNKVEDDKSSVINGFRNRSKCASTIGGGCYNAALTFQGFIGNGYQNKICTDAYTSAIINGCSNLVCSFESTIANGNANCIIDRRSFIGTGDSNIINGDCSTGRSAIITGSSNRIVGAGTRDAFIAAGRNNTICCADISSILNGYNNLVNSSQGGAIVNGRVNCITSGYNVFIGNGYCNISTKDFSTIINGNSNCANGGSAIVLNGQRNCACGEYTTVLNGYCSIAEITHGLAWGIGAKTTRFAQISHSSFQFGYSGSSQTFEVTLANQSSGSTPVNLLLEGVGGTSEIAVQNGTALNCFVEVMGIRSDGLRFGTKSEYVVIRNVGGTTSIVYQNTLVSHFTTGSWGITIQANNANDTLEIVCNGDVGDNVRWFANVWGIELAYA